MSALVKAAFVKLFSTRLWLWLLLGSVALTLLFGALAIAFGDEPDNPTPPLSSPGGQRTVFTVGFGGASALVAVLGAVGMTGEFRHGTANTTFLATPHRRRVVVAKVVAYAIVGAAFGVVCAAASVALGVPYLAAKGVSVSLAANGIPGTLVGVVLAVALYGVIGVGLGAVIRDQVATAAGLLVYLFVVEPVLTRFWALQEGTKFLPGQAAGGLTKLSQAGLEYPSPWLGGLVLAGYAAVLVVAGASVTGRRDIA